ncbi:MAG TPA: hypothetical protein VEA63_06955 [Opitutus sp.]|nr:hypothetical protein [Opitutus sp.]
MDEAAVELARTYAASIDANPLMVGQLGGGLKAMLQELGMTPKARADLMGGKVAPAANPSLDELRARREQRARQR